MNHYCDCKPAKKSAWLCYNRVMDGLALALLGPFVATYGQQLLLPFRTRALQALLAYLACEPEPHPRETLMTLIWPELPRESAQGSLRQNLYLLHQAIPALPPTSGDGTVPIVLAGRHTIQLHPNARYELDVGTFMALLAEDPSHWSEAVTLYRGDFLADFFLPASAPFEEWAAARRADLRRRCLDALAHLAGHALAAGDLAAACAYAYRQLQIDNLRENAYRQLMTALALDGQRTEALAHYQACRRLLRDALGVEPSSQTRSLYERIASGELGAVEQGPVVASVPERPRHNLPLQLTSFVGRQSELAQVRRLLDRSRLVTLTGPGGCGKTRLALEAAGQLLGSFPDGVWLVDLAPLADPLFVTKAVAAALDVAEVGGQPLVEQLLDHLQPLKLLLVLDNCEHLIAATAELAESLLHHCPEQRILATSREVLDVAGEVAWLVPSLSLPEPQAELTLARIQQSDAVRLFVERAQAVLPNFSLTEQNAHAVVHICRRLDGIALAIELAAARVSLLRVEQIAVRLDDCFHLLTGGSRTELPRHRTLAGMLDWSYDLLAPAERRLLRALAVFAGGFTLEAAEAVCACAGSDEVLELLAQLVRKSLVVGWRAPGQEARYHLLETVRQYALGKLRAAGEVEETQSRHLAYFLGLAELAKPWLRGERQLTWLNRLEGELDNFRAALSYALADGSPPLESGVRLVVALIEFLWARGNREEYGRWLALALAQRHHVGPALRVQLLSVAADLASVRFLPESPKALLEESLSLCRQLGDNRSLGETLFWLGRNAYYLGDLATAESRLSECLALAKEVDNLDQAAAACSHLSAVAQRRGDLILAKEHATAALTLARQIGDRTAEMAPLSCLGNIALSQRQFEEATRLHQEALSLARVIKHHVGEASGLLGLGDVARCQREYGRAETFYREGLEAFRAAGDNSSSSALLCLLGFAALGQGDRLRAALLFRDSLDLDCVLQWPDLMSVWGLARIALAEGYVRRATILLGAARPLFESCLISKNPIDCDDYEEDVALARSRLGEDAFTAAWAEGEPLSIDEAIALALAEPVPTH
jgi:predicted ATPase/DNA-binding SARP family transcriptional activator